MRRVAQSDTFHGTAAGQTPYIADLAEKLGLSERQAQCVALLRMGTDTAALCDVLGISTSTRDTHLAELRRKFEVDTSADLGPVLEALISDDELAPYHCWPIATNALPEGMAMIPSFQAALQAATSLEQALGALKHALSSINARHIYYCFVPHSVQGFLKADFWDAFLANEAIETAFKANNGLMGQPVAMTLFNAPVSVPVVSIDREAKPASLGAFYRACADDGATHLLGLGFPSGPGFVGMAITIAAEGDPCEAVAAQAENIRSAAMAMHASVLTTGTLAARVRLTVRERDALSAVALGKKAADAAAEMKISERAYAKLLSSSRLKFNAKTNAEAVCKAVQVNALVFL